MSQPYSGIQQLMIDKGSTLSIARVCSNAFGSPLSCNKTLTMDNRLLVPHIGKKYVKHFTIFQR